MQSFIENRPLLPVQPYFETTAQRYYEKHVCKLGISHFYHYCIDDPSGTTVAVPDGCIDFVFDCTAGTEASASVIGTVLRHREIRTEYQHEYFGVRFLPGTYPAMLKVPNGALVERDVPLPEVLDAPGLYDRICAAGDFQTQSRVFWQAYAAAQEKREAEAADDGKARLVRAVQQLVNASGGRVSVQALSDQTGYSTRYIGRVFEELVGISPKTFCQIIRFQKLLNLLHSGGQQTLTALADACGYYDQPQFIRQFKHYTGTTPRAYRKMLEDADYSNRVVVADFSLSGRLQQ